MLQPHPKKLIVSSYTVIEYETNINANYHNHHHDDNTASDGTKLVMVVLPT